MRRILRYSSGVSKGDEPARPGSRAAGRFPQKHRRAEIRFLCRLGGGEKLLPDFEEDFDAAAARVEQGLDRLKELRLVRLNLAALTLIDNLLQRYHDLKRQRGLLDFEDLITRTVALLARNGRGSGCSTSSTAA